MVQGRQISINLGRSLAHLLSPLPASRQLPRYSTRRQPILPAPCDAARPRRMEEPPHMSGTNELIPLPDAAGLAEALAYGERYLEFRQRFDRIPGVQAAVWGAGEV